MIPYFQKEKTYLFNFSLCQNKYLTDCISLACCVSEFNVANRKRAESTKTQSETQTKFKCYTLYSIYTDDVEREKEEEESGVQWGKKFSFHFARHLRRRRFKLLQCCCH